MLRVGHVPSYARFVKLASAALLVTFTLFVSTASAGVEAPTDCPPGSTGKVSGTFAWCEPSVCLHDGNCAPDVCRTVPLCVEVGTLADAGQTGEQRLNAVQRCGAGNSCPSSTTCSVKDRCLSKLQAQKLGLLEKPAPAPSAPTTPEPPPKKASCGCDTPGTRTDGTSGAVVAIAIAGVLVARRRRASN